MTSLDAPPYTNHDTSQLSNHRENLPWFSLDVLFDDHEDPRDVTIFSPDEAEITSHWITARIEDAVPLDEVA